MDNKPTTSNQPKLGPAAGGMPAEPAPSAPVTPANPAVPTPAAPADPAAPVSGAPSSLGSSTLAPSIPTETPAPQLATDPAPKKKKTGLIAFIIILILLLLGGGGFAIWYFCIYNTPEHAVAEAMSTVITSENVLTNASFYAAHTDGRGNQDFSTQVTLERSANRLPNQYLMKVSVNTASGPADPLNSLCLDEDCAPPSSTFSMKLGLGAIIMDDGILYLQPTGLTDTLDAAYGANLGIDEETYNAIYDVVDSVDNEWWQVDLAKILDALGAPEDEAGYVVEGYKCILNSIQSMDRQEFLDLYKRHSFLKITDAKSNIAPQSGNTRYGIDIDTRALTDFINAGYDSKLTDALLTCLDDTFRKLGNKTSIKNATRTEISEDTVKRFFPETWSLEFEISNFGHQLRLLDFNATPSEGTSIVFAMGFGYKTVEVTAPDSYRSATELIDELTGLYLDPQDAPIYTDTSLPDDEDQP